MLRVRLKLYGLPWIAYSKQSPNPKITPVDSEMLNNGFRFVKLLYFENTFFMTVRTISV